MDDLDLVTIATVLDPATAWVIKAKLESEGIYCFVADEHILTIQPWYSYALGGRRIQVRRADIDRAWDVIEEEEVNLESEEVADMIEEEEISPGVYADPNARLRSIIPFEKKDVIFFILVAVLLFALSRFIEPDMRERPKPLEPPIHYPYGILDFSGIPRGDY